MPFHYSGGAALVLCLMGCGADTSHPPDATVRPAANLQEFSVRGVITEMKPGNRTVVVNHQAIPNYMEAMTMPFNVKDAHELTNLRVGDAIGFRLCVTEEESWIQKVRKLNTAEAPDLQTAGSIEHKAAGAPPSGHPLLYYSFTNELGQPVRLSDFRGGALALTFFFTRCPIPDYCPRLSKNFQEASRLLAADPSAPTNYHFLSVTIDPEFDSPSILRAYAERYQYDSNHWSFLTGPGGKIRELAEQSGMSYDDANVAQHTFRTLVIDASGQLQTTFPVGGNLSKPLLREILRAAKAPAEKK